MYLKDLCKGKLEMHRVMLTDQFSLCLRAAEEKRGISTCDLEGAAVFSSEVCEPERG